MLTLLPERDLTPKLSDFGIGINEDSVRKIKNVLNNVLKPERHTTTHTIPKPLQH